MLGRVPTAALAGFLFLCHWASQILNASWVAQQSLPGEMAEEILRFSPRLEQVEVGLGSGRWLLSCHRTPALGKPQRKQTQTRGRSRVGPYSGLRQGDWEGDRGAWTEG